MICVVDRPLTGYLFLLDVPPLLLLVPFFVEVEDVASVGCFGITNAFVCLSRYRSLHNADINGKSRLRLFSRNVRMSSIPSSFPSSCSSTVLDFGVFFGDEDDEEADGSGWFFSRFCISYGGGGGGGGSLRCLNCGRDCSLMLEGESKHFKMFSSLLVLENAWRVCGCAGAGGSRLRL